MKPLFRTTFRGECPNRLKSDFLSITVLFLLLLFGATCCLAAQPNLVVILADDLGWMDINPTAELATGTSVDQQFYETPHLNDLAKEGVSFSRCYSMPLCSPSRATMLTGRNGATFGFNNAAGMRSAKWTYALKGMTPPGDYQMHDRVAGTSPRFPVAGAIGNYALPNGLPDSKGQKLYA